MKTRETNVSLNIPVIFQPEPEGGFTVTVPSLPGCVTYGRTLVHAKKMAREAIELYIEDMAADGEPLHHDTDAFLSTVSAAVPRSVLAHA